MSKKLEAGDLNSGFSLTDVGESEGELSGGMVEGFKSKTLGEDSIEKVGLGDGVRVSEEMKVLDGASINGSGRNVFESGSIEMNSFYGGSKNRVAEMKSRNRGWESWGVMDLVERVLGGKYRMNNESGDVKIPEKQPEANLASDMNSWQYMIREPTPKHGIDNKETVLKGDLDQLHLEFQVKGNSLNGNHDSIFSEIVPDGKMETEGVDDPKANVSTSNKLGERITEKEGEYHVSDLVWGKVRSHPWWPGQIFEPSAASDKAKKYFKRNSYLIAYFGDHTFAWNDVSKIKPFHMHFSQMEKESSVDGFFHAVKCALDEVSRRVELSLSCSCLPQEVLDLLKFQEVVNAGIREESRTIAGGDNLLSAASFLPEELMRFLESLAQSHKRKADRLQLTMTKAQLLAFNRWKGNYHHPIYEECGRFLEDASQLVATGEAKESIQGPAMQSINNVPSKKRKSTARGSSQKRKCFSGNEESPQIKEKPMSVLMSLSSSSIQNDQKPTRWEIIPSEIPPPDVILSELTLAAKNPKKDCEARISFVRLLHEFRNTICLEKFSPECTTQEKLSNLKTVNVFGVDGTEDSYWTDRIIQSNSEDQSILVPENASERASELEANTGAGLNSVGTSIEEKIVCTGLDSEDSPVPMNVASEEHFPTALILNFSSLQSIPSIANLNEIFRQYGPLKELETDILTKSKRAKVIFKRREDAETAFSSTGKYSIFGPSLVSYRLNYAPVLQKPRAKSKHCWKHL